MKLRFLDALLQKMPTTYYVILKAKKVIIKDNYFKY